MSCSITSSYRCIFAKFSLIIFENQNLEYRLFLHSCHLLEKVIHQSMSDNYTIVTSILFTGKSLRFFSRYTVFSPKQDFIGMNIF